MKVKWTDEEVAELRRMAKLDMSWRQVAAHMGRSDASIRNKAVMLKLVKAERAKPKAPTWALIELACADGVPRSAVQLAAQLKTTPKWVHRLLRSFGQDGLAHVARWERGEDGKLVPYWLPVPGVSARKPKPLTVKQVNARFRKKLKDDPIRHKTLTDRYNTRAREKYRGRVQPDVAASWLFAPVAGDVIRVA